MSATTEKAILAGGCFWGMQDLIRKRPGIISTRVGYSGGDVPNATYRNHGTHAEAIEITFDPSVTSYREILEFFFQIHDPTTRNRQGNDVGHELPLGDLLPERRAAPGRRGHHRRRGGLRPLAGQGRHRGRPGGPVLGGGAGAPGLSGAVPQRVHVPLPPPGLGAAPSERRRRQLTGPAPARGPRSPRVRPRTGARKKLRMTSLISSPDVGPGEHDVDHGQGGVDVAPGRQVANRDPGGGERVREGDSLVAQRVELGGDDERRGKARQACRRSGEALGSTRSAGSAYRSQNHRISGAVRT